MQFLTRTEIIRSSHEAHPLIKSVAMSSRQASIMAVVHAALSTALRKLCAVLQERYGILGVRREITFLVDELQTLQASLKLAAPPDGDYYFVKLREVSYDVEDIADEFVLRMERQHGFRTVVDKAKDLIASLRTRRQMARQIGDLKRRLKNMSDRLGGFVASSPSRWSVPVEEGAGDPPPALQGDDDATILVGMDGPRDEVLKLIMREEEPESAARRAVIAISGVGGIGKTTLAQHVFCATEPYFGCRAWVSVSRKPKLKDILRGMLRQVEDPHSSTGNAGDSERDLIRKIKQSLQRKR